MRPILPSSFFHVSNKSMIRSSIMICILDLHLTFTLSCCVTLLGRPALANYKTITSVYLNCCVSMLIMSDGYLANVSIAR